MVRLAMLMLFAIAARAEMPVRITEAKIGLPAGKFAESATIAKLGTWVPVEVEIEIAGPVDQEAAIVLETTDSDDLTVRTFAQLPGLADIAPGGKYRTTRITPYVRPGGALRGDVKLTVCRFAPDVPPEQWAPLSEPFTLRSITLRESHRYILLSLGSDQPGFLLPRESGSSDAEPSEGQPLRSGRFETAAIVNVEQMPDRWYGYDAVDLIVLNTSNEAFLKSLLETANKPRIDALQEWLRRGGRMIVGIGKNASLIASTELAAMLPVAVATENAMLTNLSMAWQDAAIRASANFDALEQRSREPFPVAKFTAKAMPAHFALAGEDGRLVVAQGAFGLGRITAVAFDLDAAPFNNYRKRAEYWNLLVNEAGSAKAANWALGARTSAGEADLAGKLRQHLDVFEGVPVVSFGWVAGFLLLYTLLIGPLEYLFLRKVLGRLELTWLTFPLIVLTISTLAYFTAYSIKGRELRINKIDVVDIDPASGRIYGRTFVALFSPKIDTYRIGIDPATGWAAPECQAPAGSLVDWYGEGRSGGRSLLRRSYWHVLDGAAPFENGLVDVPVPIWSTKAFQADWSAELNVSQPPVLSNLRHPRSNPESVAGSFTLNLPVEELPEAYAIYAGIAYKLENPIRRGLPVNLVLDSRLADANWLVNYNARTAFSLGSEVESRSTRPRQAAESSVLPRAMADLLFHDARFEANDAQSALNGGLRRLDHSWRVSVRNRNEVIIVARLPSLSGPAEEQPAPSRLWLRGRPGEGPRTPLPGQLKQDTYLRIFIPIAPQAP